MLVSSNRRNFKRRRDGRSPSVFNIWSRDADHKGVECESGDVSSYRYGATFTENHNNYDNDGCNNVKLYGYRQCLSSHNSTANYSLPDRLPTFQYEMTKVKGEAEDDDDEIWTDSTTPITTDPYSPTLPLSSETGSSRPNFFQVAYTLAGIMRLLSVIPKVTCISHYCSRLFSHQSNHLQTDTYSTSPNKTFSSSQKGMNSSYTMRTRTHSCGTPGLALDRGGNKLGNCGGGRRSLNSKRVRCQIRSVRSDFISIIVFTLCILFPRVAPVITSNEVYPMDAASPVVPDRNDPGKSKGKIIMGFK
jgi:hypothetical protein